MTGPNFDQDPSENMIRYIKAGVISFAIVIAGIATVNQLTTKDEPNTTGSPIASEATSPQAGMAQTVVVAKDNYTLVARRLVTSSLSVEQARTTPHGARLYAETKLVRDIQSQPLLTGKAITISSEIISKYLSEYPSLSGSQKQQWEAWARSVKW